MFDDSGFGGNGFLPRHGTASTMSAGCAANTSSMLLSFVCAMQSVSGSASYLSSSCRSEGALLRAPLALPPARPFTCRSSAATLCMCSSATLWLTIVCSTMQPAGSISNSLRSLTLKQIHDVRPLSPHLTSLLCRTHPCSSLNVFGARAVVQGTADAVDDQYMVDGTKLETVHIQHESLEQA